MKLKRLSPEDFDHAAAQTRLEERTKQLARAVLVDGEPLTDVAARWGMTKQRISLAVGVVEKAYFASNRGGFGWVALEVELPEVIALQLDDVFQRLRNNNDQAKLEEATQIITRALRKTSGLLG